MNPSDTVNTATYVIDTDGLALILDNLAARAYSVVGPTVVDDAIVYGPIDKLGDLPQGWSDQQDAGVYRIEHSDDPRYFNYTTGPHSWKKFLHPPEVRLWQAQRQGSSFRVIPETEDKQAFAFIGVRPCDLKAIQIQDRIFQGDVYTDHHYDSARNKAFIMAINCGRANSTCFCTSMDTGPRASDGYDLAITEFFDHDQHLFLLEVASLQGEEVLEDVPIIKAEADQLAICQQQYEATRASMTRVMDTANLRETLLANPEHPQWDEVAERCLSCANCTMSCPTCFCTTVEDTTDLTGDHAERWRRWDSCFTMDFSYIAGGHIRNSTKSRYRQWLTHKLATWHDQFESSGCVGCGRCITWCPVGIDITEEVAAIQNSPATRHL